MEINKDSRSYKIWKSTYSFHYEYTPEQTDLCSFMRRVYIKAPLMCLSYGIYNLLAFCFGSRPYSFNPFNSGFYSTYDYDGLKIGKRELYPWTAIAAILFVLFNIYGAIYALYPLVFLGIFYTLFLLAGVLFYIIFNDNESLIPKWLTAKKEKVCPLVSFVSNDKEDADDK
jgi:hypothetical protein